MKILFTRTGERNYSTIAQRADGSQLKIPGYGNPSPIPHDLLHFVVESELGFKHGFWGCVAAGAIFSGMEILKGRQKPHAAELAKKVIKDFRDELAEAETLAGAIFRIFREGDPGDWPGSQRYLKTVWQPPKPSRGPLSASEFESIGKKVKALEEAWKKLPLGETLTVEWKESPPSRR